MELLPELVALVNAAAEVGVMQQSFFLHGLIALLSAKEGYDISYTRSHVRPVLR